MSCIMPTYNRRDFVPLAIRYFLRQEYENKELIIIDDGTDIVRDLIPDSELIRYFYLDKKITLGAKLNLACEYAKGNIVVHWDDDDWYAPNRLFYQVESLLHDDVDVCGINRLLYYDLHRKNAWQYIYPSNRRVWLLGSSLCYKKNLWQGNQFADINVGMDGLFVWATPAERVGVLPDNSIAVHMIHGNNVSPKKTEGTWWHIYSTEKIQKVMGTDWYLYDGNQKTLELPEVKSREAKIANTSNGRKLLQNLHLCLVHENQECISDLLENLRYHDPDSQILLSNGSGNPDLIPKHFPLQEYKATLVPNNQRVKHGYLHNSALETMKFALDNFYFDTLTIVDSDQLAIRSGYTAYITDFLASHTGIGLMSSMPQRVHKNDKTKYVALQAFSEYSLWEPFIKNFPDGESKFVHWTFWPSTVFTYDAVRDIVKLFKENSLLQHIMCHTKIWATEEVIFPTLVKLLGYEIVTNPCCHDVVKYKTLFSIPEFNQALTRPGAFWIHPVTRKYEDPLRRFIRLHFNNYDSGNKEAALEENLSAYSFKILALKKISRIQGWLNKQEAGFLFDTVIKACTDCPGADAVVETGSFHGKSTVLFAMIIRKFFPVYRIYAVDRHDGKLGAEDMGLKIFPPSLDMFKQNIALENLEDFIEVIQNNTSDIEWNRPVAFLFIDGLHDYKNVSRDFYCFSGWLVKGGYVAFHDYASYYPGVMAFVNELLCTATFRSAGKVHSLIILQKL